MFVYRLFTVVFISSTRGKAYPTVGLFGVLTSVLSYIRKQFSVIASPPRPLVRLFRNLSGMFPGGLLVHPEMWVQSINKCGQYQPFWSFHVIASLP